MTSSPVTVMALPFPTMADLLVNLLICGTITLTLDQRKNDWLELEKGI